MMGGGDKRGYMPMINYTIVYIDDCNDNSLACLQYLGEMFRERVFEGELLATV